MLKINLYVNYKKKNFEKKRDAYVKVPETKRQLYNCHGDLTELLYSGATVAIPVLVKQRGQKKIKSYCG